jgi:hypothetical protein
LRLGRADLVVELAVEWVAVAADLLVAAGEPGVEDVRRDAGGLGGDVRENRRRG